MATVTIQASLSTDELLHAVEQLDPTSLERFTQNVLLLNAKHRTPLLPIEETELIRAINESRPPDFQQRYKDLISKRDNGSLTASEYTELLEKTEEAEAYDALRLERLWELAQHRGLTLDEVMAQLCISKPSNG